MVLVILIISNHAFLLYFMVFNFLTFKLSTGNASAGKSFFPFMRSGMSRITRGMVLKKTSNTVNFVIESPGG